ncbi:MAG TPA: hypothetical protein VK172_14675 [Lentimicrobium sp.]|nr:hypothetical protein [Bacteroidales bacterium]HLO92406.1 hypothetical protein [Lentimicrobium sp.]
MNTIDFNKNDFPLTTSVFTFLQNAIKDIEKIAGILTGNYIISGCETVGGSVNAGYVVVGGTILKFDGGPMQNWVRVETTDSVITVGDATYTTTVKKLVWGTLNNQLLWSAFRRAPEVIENPTLSLDTITGSGSMRRKVINIGDWNMQTTANINVDDNTLEWDKIRSIKVLIRGDEGQYVMRDLLEAGNYSVSSNGGNARIALTRDASPGRFAVNDSYNSTSYNRGYIVIDYVL